LVEILTVLSASGFDDLLGELGLRSCTSPSCALHRRIGFERARTMSGLPLTRPERLTFVLERLGPTFVKLGQMAALRPDHVPAPYTKALSRLHDRAKPFPAAEARAVAEDELGASRRSPESAGDPRGLRRGHGGRHALNHPGAG